MEHFTQEQRMILQSLWNGNAKRGRATRLSARAFAEEHGIPHPTLLRELGRGMDGKIFYDRIRREWFYPEYSAAKAQADAADKAAQQGAGMKFTNRLAEAFRHQIIDLKKSPAHARHSLLAAGHAYLPCVRSVYNHIDRGDIGILRGQTPYRPTGERKRKKPARRALKCLSNLSIEERPQQATQRAEPGHWEADTIVSCVGGRGGLLVLADRMTRFTFIVHLKAVTARAVRNAIRGLLRSGCLKVVRSITTDNGCEFLDAAALGKLFKGINADLRVYYTHAYAAWEKGTVENVNRHIRRFFPKGTDFRRVSVAAVAATQHFINSIPRTHSLKGKTAHEAFIAAA
jgi:IS30 family transposase